MSNDKNQVVQTLRRHLQLLEEQEMRVYQMECQMREQWRTTEEQLQQQRQILHEQALELRLQLLQQEGTREIQQQEGQEIQQQEAQKIQQQEAQEIQQFQQSSLTIVAVKSERASVVSQPMLNGHRTVIWKGMLEWVEKSKTTLDAQKLTWQVPCQISTILKDGKPEVEAESWPLKLIMQLIPKAEIGNIGQAYLKNSKSVVFFPSSCEALELLIKMMSSGFAGCVNFTSTPTCNIKVLLLLYTAEKQTFIGFIPNDQQAFVDRLRKVIQQQKSTQSEKKMVLRNYKKCN